ncbi:MAG: alpha-L-fucosidase [Kiritimatiellia bacterium]
MSLGLVCDECDVYEAAEQAVAADKRYRMYVFWLGKVKRTEDADLAFRAHVACIRAHDPHANVTLVVQDSGWRKAARELSVIFSDARDIRLITGELRVAYERGWGVDWSVVRAHEKVVSPRTQRLHDAKWGVFNHFLGHDCKTAAEWNAKVARFDVGRVADQLEACGATFYFLTVMQGNRWMCAPSATYDSIAGTKPGEACSVRDLPLELSAELEKRGMDLYLYFTGDGPCRDPEIGSRFGFAIDPDHLYAEVTEAFVRKWSSVLGDLARRYGNKVKGWWLDGCYDDMLGYTDELLGLYGEAVRAGNPAALVSMNNGVFPYFRKHWSGEDFTAGEFNDFHCVPEKRFIEGAQAFVLAPLGAWRGDYCGWASSGCKRSADYVAQYVQLVNANGGVVCIDVKVSPDGAWEPDQMEVLKAVGRATGTLK